MRSACAARLPTKILSSACAGKPLLRSIQRARAGGAMAAASAAAAREAAAEAPPPAPPPLCRVAVAQMTATSDPEKNFAVCASLAEQAARGGARMLFLPECFAFIGEKQADALAFAQPLSGPLMTRYRALAARHGLWLSLGGFQERCPLPGEPPIWGQGGGEDEEGDGGVQEEVTEDKQPGPAPPPLPPAEKVYNAHVVVRPSGRIAAVYRKVHLFDVDAPGGGPVLLESRTTNPGDRLVVVPGPAEADDDDEEEEPCPCGPLGLTTCYDLRFPEMFAALAFGTGGRGGGGGGQVGGARVLAVPSAFTKVTGAAHWELLLRARAVETQCYVVAAAQAGRHSQGRESYGDALVVDPWGDVVARVPEGPLATGLAFADLDARRVAEVRRRMPIALHREAGRRRWAK